MEVGFQEVMWVRLSHMVGAVTTGLVSLHEKEKTLDTFLSLCTHQGRLSEDTTRKKALTKNPTCQHPDLRTVGNKPHNHGIPSQWPELMKTCTLAMGDVT